MDAHGRKTDVIIEDIPSGEVQSMFGSHYQDNSNRLRIWADKTMGKYLKKLPGIVDVASEGVQYIVALDPRYDRSFVKQEIIAIIKLHQPSDHSDMFDKAKIIEAAKEVEPA